MFSRTRNSPISAWRSFRPVDQLVDFRCQIGPDRPAKVEAIDVGSWRAEALGGSPDVSDEAVGAAQHHVMIREVTADQFAQAVGVESISARGVELVEGDESG